MVFEIRTDILTTIVSVLDACNGVFEIRTDILTTIVGVLDACYRVMGCLRLGRIY